MVPLPGGGEFDVNSTPAVLELLAADRTLNADVVRAVFVLLDQKGALDGQRRHVETHGAPPPEVLDEARGQAFDAYGVIATKLADTEEQLKQLDAKPTYVARIKKELRAPLDKQHAELRRQLSVAHAMIASWGLEPDAAVADTPPGQFKELPIAAEPTTTMQTVLGSVAYRAGLGAQKYTTQFREDEDRPLRPVDRDGLAGTEAVKHDPRGAAYFTARSGVNVELIRAVTRDTERFQSGYDAATRGADDQASLAEVAALPAGVPQRLPGTGAKASTAAAAELAAGHAPTNLEYVVLARWWAARASIALYIAASRAVAGARGAVVLPGPVKGVARIVFKTLLNYANFAQVKDLARLTIVIGSLGEMVETSRRLLGCRELVFARLKNRWPADYDVGKTGGYRDLQGVVLLSLGERGHAVCEVQQNLRSFVEIKAGSHGPFEKSRATDANSAAVTEWTGEPTAEVIDRIATGVLVKADFNREAISAETAAALGAALGSKECRLEVLEMAYFTYPGDGGVLAAWKAHLAPGLLKSSPLRKPKYGLISRVFCISLAPWPLALDLWPFTP